MHTNESAFTPQRTRSAGNMFLTIVILAAIAWFIYYFFHVTTPTVIDKPIATPAAQVIATPETRQSCYNGKCVAVVMCTAVGGDCASIEQGPPADYGTGFHDSGEGATVLNSGVVYQNHRKRPNPPAGWHFHPDGQ